MSHCPACTSEFTYNDGNMLVCSACAHEWIDNGGSTAAPVEQKPLVKDANGQILKNGDTVTVVKDLKVKGSSLVIKVGTKAKNIKLIEGDHDIDCKVDGIGPMQLKSQFVKKI